MRFLSTLEFLAEPAGTMFQRQVGDEVTEPLVKGETLGHFHVGASHEHYLYEERQMFYGSTPKRVVVYFSGILEDAQRDSLDRDCYLVWDSAEQTMHHDMIQRFLGLSPKSDWVFNLFNSKT